MNNIPTSRPPRFSLRFFIYFLFGLVILILAIEGGYYFWIQRQRSFIRDYFPKEEFYVYEKQIENYKFVTGEVVGVNGNLITLKKGSETATFKVKNDTEFYIITQLSSTEFKEEERAILGDAVENILREGDFIMRAQIDNGELGNTGVWGEDGKIVSPIKVFR